MSVFGHQGENEGVNVHMALRNRVEDVYRVASVPITGSVACLYLTLKTDTGGGTLLLGDCMSGARAAAAYCNCAKGQH